MRIGFTKAHGARNDFLLTWAQDAPGEPFLPAIARAICDRHSGVGADGWILVKPAPAEAGCDATIRLFNADGSEAEISGNGTRCAAAFLLDTGAAVNTDLHIGTGAGIKRLRLIERRGLACLFEMNMGQAVVVEERTALPLARGPQQATIIDIGNPQCAVFVERFDFDWRAMGAEIERHSRFPHRTNVSFIRPVDEHTIEVRFYERGVGETMSSGTGSTAAAAAAMRRGLARSPVRVLTPAGPLDIRWQEDFYLTGPAEIIAGGEFYYQT